MNSLAILIESTSSAIVRNLDAVLREVNAKDTARIERCAIRARRMNTYVDLLKPLVRNPK